MGLRAWSAFPGHVGNAIAFMLFGGVLNMLASTERSSTTGSASLAWARVWSSCT